MILKDINAAFVSFVFKGVVLHISCEQSPQNICFYPTNIFVKQKFSYFCNVFIFLVLVVNLIVSFSLIERLLSLVHLLLVLA